MFMLGFFTSLEIYTSLIFRCFIVPLAAVILSYFVKLASKNDRYSTFRKEDLAVGLEMSLTAVIAFVVYCFSIANQIYGNNDLSVENIGFLKDKLVSGLALIVIFSIGLWGISTFVRKRGWKGKDELKWLVGIIIPFIYGVITLISVVIYMGD